MLDFTIVIPAKNEEVGLKKLLPELRSVYPQVAVIIVSDGSTDQTVEIAHQYGCQVIEHPYSLGNGAAVKSGIRAVKTTHVLMMDADGQHPVCYIKDLLEKSSQGVDLVVGARSWSSQASVFRGVANKIYNWLASQMTGHKIEDLTSGFRIFKTAQIKKFLYILPNKFSYPTTSTMTLLRAGFNVGYVPIIGPQREGESHINIVKDGLRFFIIIFKIATLFSPLKVFIPISLVFFTSGFIYSLYTILEMGRFTNMSGLLFSVSVLVFLIGLVSEQITALMYKDSD